MVCANRAYHSPNNLREVVMAPALSPWWTSVSVCSLSWYRKGTRGGGQYMYWYNGAYERLCIQRHRTHHRTKNWLRKRK